ncbi:MAG TPA: 4-alpha-glucanotransferase [Aggregatilineales bacterium]|nr:4-alpha-glucanotransferase [Chloroflexota bacterium]HPV07143.1 4-alpha-glucanotransferase [Aggregatilineales bacterium]HQA67541.1 4-alpha-glucanotransferase [Aggregatilineales bacterium]
MNLFPRSSGILLHPTSLPGRYGIGDLGDWAFRFVDWLAANGQTVWQVLPLGPTGYGDSPYQTLSAFAGNPLLISLDRLVEHGWLTHEDVADVPDFPAHQVDFGRVGPYHNEKLSAAYARFEAGGRSADFHAWCEENAHWLEDYALFAALKDHFNQRPWVEWPQPYALRDDNALAQAREEHARRIDEHRFRQWVFHQQWAALKTYANERNIRIFGDLPIFVAHDSADVWAHPELFYLDERGNPTVVAGVPPDYFSATGQRWGNPLYRWNVMKETGYAWWLSRLRALFKVVDYVRIDHFRGFEAYWEIPAEEETAVKGQWVKGPGHDFFEVVQRELGELPIIAEDLGVITREVEELRKAFNLPGMKVLQFAWSHPKNPFLPHNHEQNCVVYSGTHDNNTTHGWWKHETDDSTRAFMSDYLGHGIDDPAWTLMKVGMRSVAHTFIVPMQDVLGLDAWARMNTPGNPSGNWTWRFTPEQLEHQANPGLAHLTWLYQRRPDQQEREYGDVAVRESEHAEG